MTTTNKGSARVTLPSDTQILITREFDAPPHLVFRVWTTPELVQKWWAGEHGITTTVDMDFRVGGTWRYVLVTTNGDEVAFHGEYREVVPDQRVVWTEHMEGPWPEGEPVVNTLTLIEHDDGRTLLELLSDCPDQQVRDTIINYGMESGMQEQMDIIARLAVALD